ncbi:MAG: glutamine--tRNA ligase, partial [Planctomycetota bacterium]
LTAEVRLYDRLFSAPNPGQATGSYLDDLNPDSLEILTDCRVEAGLGDERPGYQCQFERQGYFCIDPDSSGDRLVFNRTVALRDTWARIQKAAGG